jgi:hypothetical protein
VVSKKLLNTVKIGAATTKEISRDDAYQIFIFPNPIFYITLIIIFKKLPLVTREVNTNSNTNLRERL